jgi:DNA-binding XRE family transcriptional regulator
MFLSKTNNKISLNYEKALKYCLKGCILMFFSTILLGLNSCHSPTLPPSIGEQIRTARLKQNISQVELAEAVGLHLVSLSLIEDGFATPIAGKIKAIEQYLKVSLDWEE